VFHHGQPGAALLWPELVSEADRFGWSVVMVTRPGYATSERHVGRRVSDAVTDAAAVLDHLGIDRFLTAGQSGGGPHALACAALLPSRCRAAATIAGLAPYDGVHDLDWTAGMGPENLAEFEALIAGDRGLEAQIKELNDELGTIQADQLIDALGGLLSKPDKKVLAGPAANFLAKMTRLSASAGHYGYWDDGQAFVRDWGFAPQAIRVPVTVWIAGQDLMVPPAHGEWLAQNIPGADRARMEEEGHISLYIRHVKEIVEKLARDANL
jgi:pimeloyl-ACP methyl ester carboxylesterase